MTVNAPNCSVKMVSIISGGGLKSFAPRIPASADAQPAILGGQRRHLLDEARDLTFQA